VPPEWRRLGGNTRNVCCSMLSHRLSETPVVSNVDRPSVTELPGLTSDPIYTADRRGGILISSGPNRRPVRVLNPSRWPPIRVRCGRVPFGPDRAAFALHSYRPCILKCVGTIPRRIRPTCWDFRVRSGRPVIFKGIERSSQPGGDRAPRHFASESDGQP
jgi:hypothetical protein